MLGCHRVGSFLLHGKLQRFRAYNTSYRPAANRKTDEQLPFFQLRHTFTTATAKHGQIGVTRPRLCVSTGFGSANICRPRDASALGLEPLRIAYGRTDPRRPLDGARGRGLLTDHPHVFPGVDGDTPRDCRGLITRTALAMEAAVRQVGAQPVAIAVLQGTVRVGLTAAEVEQVARSALTPPKSGPAEAKRRRLVDSLRIIAFARRTVRPRRSDRRGLSAATTVLATLSWHDAYGKNPCVVATGGLGGVHRGAARLMMFPRISTSCPGRTVASWSVPGSSRFLTCRARSKPSRRAASPS